MRSSWFQDFKSAWALALRSYCPLIYLNMILYMGVSKNHGPKCRPQNSRALIMRTPQKDGPNLALRALRALEPRVEQGYSHPEVDRIYGVCEEYLKVLAKIISIYSRMAVGFSWLLAFSCFGVSINGSVCSGVPTQEPAQTNKGSETPVAPNTPLTVPTGPIRLGRLPLGRLEIPTCVFRLSLVL